VAKKVVLVDDLDGRSPADETVRYGLDGEFFEIDLSTENAKELRDFLNKYISASRVVPAKEAARRGSSASSSGSASSGPAASDYDPATVRAWAQANGVEVSEKGRIPEAIVQKWRQATAAPAASSSDPAATSADG
jgi:hypothetical protein